MCQADVTAAGLPRRGIDGQCDIGVRPCLAGRKVDGSWDFQRVSLTVLPAHVAKRGRVQGLRCRREVVQSKLARGIRGDDTLFSTCQFAEDKDAVGDRFAVRCVNQLSCDRSGCRLARSRVRRGDSEQLAEAKEATEVGRPYHRVVP